MGNFGGFTWVHLGELLPCDVLNVFLFLFSQENNHDTGAKTGRRSRDFSGVLCHFHFSSFCIFLATWGVGCGIFFYCLLFSSFFFFFVFSPLALLSSHQIETSFMGEFDTRIYEWVFFSFLSPLATYHL